MPNEIQKLLDEHLKMAQEFEAEQRRLLKKMHREWGIACFFFGFGLGIFLGHILGAISF